MIPLALSLLVPLAVGQAPAGPVVVPPVVVVAGGIAPRLAQKVHGVLVRELRTAGVVVVESEPPPLAAVPVEPFHHLDAGYTAWSSRRMSAAAAHAQAAVEGLRGAVLDSPRPVVEALTLRAVTAYSLGQDDAGVQLVERALALGPADPLPFTEGSRGFTEIVEAARARVRALPPGTLAVESAPAGSPVAVDGVAVGSTPVVVTGLVPGEHLWTVDLQTGERTGGLVAVAPRGKATVSARPAQEGLVARLVSAVARNTVDAAAASAARSHAEALTAARTVVAALSADGAQLALDVVVVGSDVRRLPRVSFDRELLSAGERLLEVATGVARGGGEAVALPAGIVQGVSPPAPREVDFGAVGRGTPQVEPAVDVAAPPSAPPAERKRRTPLVRP